MVSLGAWYGKRVWMKRVLVFGLISVLGAIRLWGCQKDRTLSVRDDDFSRYNGQTFSCVKVVDGDTIDIDIPDPKAKKPKAFTRIRMWGIDTPEIEHFGKPAMYYGYEAAEFARKLMAGKKVRLELIEGDTRCKFGRLLAYVYLPDGRMYNELAVKEGFAYAEVRFPHPKRAAFIQLETEARDNLRGLWSGLTPDQLPNWYKPARINEFWAARPQTDSSSSTPKPATYKKNRKHKTPVFTE
jgi:micrococcal nuclease